MERERLFLITDNVDDSIKSVTPIYDITIFSNFLKFEEYINKTPVKLSTIIISERVFSFTSSNISRLLVCLNAPFLTMTGRCIYLISENTNKDMVHNFLVDNDIENIVTYQGDLSSRFVTDVISGAARISDESETEIITYRMRASEYYMTQHLKKYETDKHKYVTDEDLMKRVPTINEPMVDYPKVEVLSNVHYVVGKKSLERTLFTFIEAQYLSLSGKTIILESDIEYYRLSDIVLRADVKYKFINIKDLLANPMEVIYDIRQCGVNLIVIGSKTKLYYDYNFIFDILLSNLTGWIDYFVKECDYDQTPYGSYYNIVCKDTVPDILECCNSLLYEVDDDKVIMIGVRMCNKMAINVTSTEMTSIVRQVLEKEKIVAEVIELNGLTLRGENVVYDIFSLLTRGNERQS